MAGLPSRSGLRLLPEHGVLALLGRGGDEPEIELAPDDRSDTEHLVGLRREAAESLADDLAHTLGESRFIHRDGALPSTFLLHQHARVGEMTQHLAHEEGVAFGLPGQCRGEGPADLVQLVAAGPGQELHDLGVVHAPQCDPLDAGGPTEFADGTRQRVHPVDVGVPIGHDDEHAGVPRQVRDHASQERHAGLIGPVGVLDDEEDRSHGGQADDEVDRGVVDGETLRLGIEVPQRGQIGDAGPELGHEAAQVTTSTLDVVTQDRLLGMGDRMAEDLQPWRVRRLDLLVASTGEHPRPLFVGGSGGLGGQPGLALTGLAADEHHRPAVVAGGLPRIVEHLARLVAPGEGKLTRGRCQGPGQWRHLSGRRHRPGHLIRHDRLRQPLELPLADEDHGVLGAVAGQTAHQVVAQDLPTLGRVAEAGGRDHRDPVAVAVLPHHVTRADADPDGELGGGAVPSVDHLDPLLAVHRGGNGIGSSREGRQQTVAQSLDDLAVVAQHRFPPRLVLGPEQLVGAVISQSRPQVGRRDEVREQNGRSARPAIPHTAHSR